MIMHLTDNVAQRSCVTRQTPAPIVAKVGLIPGLLGLTVELTRGQRSSVKHEESSFVGGISNPYRLRRVHRAATYCCSYLEVHPSAKGLIYGSAIQAAAHHGVKKWRKLCWMPVLRLTLNEDITVMRCKPRQEMDKYARYKCD